MDIILAIPNRVQNDSIFFVTLNLFQGRKDLKISFPAARFELIDFNLAIPNQVRNDGTLFITWQLNNPKTLPTPALPELGREQS